MKYFFILFLTSIISFNCSSQFNIDLGPDKIYCKGNINPDTVFLLGDSLKITGGIPPYTFRWETSYTFLSYHTTAIDYLSDTTISNPIITNFSNDSSFYLYVTDSLGNVAVDSIRMSYSSFGHHAAYATYSINPGDSVYCWASTPPGGIYPRTFVWRPNHGLTDSTSPSFWAKPTQNIKYYMVVTDAIGCKNRNPQVFWITVNYVSIDEKDLLNSSVKAFPNPSNKYITLSYEGNISSLINYSIFNSEGKIVYQKESLEKSITFETNKLEKGVYFYCINSNTNKIGKGKFIVN